MVSRLEMVLKELNENGNFRASLFSTSSLISRMAPGAVARSRRIQPSHLRLNCWVSKAPIDTVYRVKKQYALCRCIWFLAAAAMALPP